MNKSDKYYMKQGKLELSMLDSDDDDVILQSSEKNEDKRELFSDIEFQHTRKIRDRRDSKTIRPQDIYSTLQSMGQFLVKSEEADIAKAQKLAKIGSTLKIEDMELPPRKEEKVVNKNDALATNQPPEIQTEQDNNLEYVQRENKEKIKDIKSNTKDVVAEQKESVTPNNEIVELSDQNADRLEINKEEDLLQKTNGTSYKDSYETINAVKNDNDNNKNIAHVNSEDKDDTKSRNVISKVVSSESSDKVNILEDIPEDMDTELQQNQIDKILNLHFGRIRANYPDAKMFKSYIDEQIAKIENYGS